ncbi:flagellar protein FliT [Castellaniella caeni]|uniref:flagellar protein FliT n=1 Tax=Castellaniella caeni TaxID=266123 RepID=UPI0009FC9ECB|nr:flagellar protein FliT [Castellaniella caeni]
MSAPPDTLLQHYQAIADISSRMRALAQSQRWDELVELGTHYHQAVERLQKMAPLDDEQKAARRDLLARILDDDAHIRQLVAPELDRLSHLLGTIKRQRTVLETYYSTVRPR